MGDLNRRDELEAFKREINLCEYAASHGFELIQRKSSRHSAVMKHPCGDKVVIAKSSSGHWIYFNPLDSQDHGTVIDFLQNRQGLSLGGVRKELRKWQGGTVPNAPETRFADLTPSTADAAKVLSVWEGARTTEGSLPFLERDRGISRTVLSDPIFADRFRVDRRGNVLFPHWNSEQLCGYEIKNRGFTGFAPGGIKGFWCSRPQPEDSTMVICETAIDALSYADLHGTAGTRFLSTAGQMSPLQTTLLHSAVSRMPGDAQVVIATDNDAGGISLGIKIRESIGEADGRSIVFKQPTQPGMDWNDVLRQQREQRTPSCE